jgi:ABC-type transport system substrate-binding protein
VLGAVCLLATACTGGDGGEGPAAVTGPERGPSGGTLRVGLPGPLPADPGSASPGDPAELLAADLLWDGLTALDAEGRAVPALAESWEVDDDDTTWRFTLDPDASASDGTPISTGVVVESLSRVVAQGPGSLAGTRLEIIEGHADLHSGDADVLDGLSSTTHEEVVIELVEPFGALPELLASPVYGIDLGTDGDLPVSSGRFRVDELIGGALRLTPRGDVDTPLEAVELVAHDDLEAALDALAAGDVDLVPVQPGADLDPDADGVAEVVTAPFHAEVFLGLRVAAPPLGGRPARQAIAASLDRDALVEAAYGDGALPLATLVPEGVAGHDPGACGDLCEPDLDRAADLLAEAFPEGDVPAVALAIDDAPSQQALADELADQLAQVGIELEVEPLEPEEFAALLGAREQAAFTFGWIGLHPFPDAWLAPLLGTGSPDNHTGVGFDEVDDLVAETRREEGPGDLDAWAEVEADMLERAVVIPLAQLQTRAALAEGVTGIQVRLDGTLDLSITRVEPR